MCFFIFHFYFFLLCIQQFTAHQEVHLGNPSILSLWSALFCYPSFHPLHHIFSDPISWFQNQSGYFSEQTMMSSWCDKGIPKLGTALNGNAYFLLQVFHQTIVIFLTGDSSFLLFPLYCKDRTATQCLLNQAARAENLFLKQCVELAFLMCPEKSCLTSAIVIK